MKKDKPEIDKQYWKFLRSYDDATDPLGIVLRQLEAHYEYAKTTQEFLPDCIKRLAQGRKKIVTQTEKRFSDILSMIAECGGEEDDLFETAKKVCDFYRMSRRRKRLRATKQNDSSATKTEED